MYVKRNIDTKQNFYLLTPIDHAFQYYITIKRYFRKSRKQCRPQRVKVQ